MPIPPSPSFDDLPDDPFGDSFNVAFPDRSDPGAGNHRSGDLFGVEPTARIFRRLLLRLATLGGIATGFLAWPLDTMLGALLAVPLLALCAGLGTAIVETRTAGIRAGLLTAQLVLGVVVVAAVMTEAGFAGFLLVLICRGLSDPLRAATASWWRQSAAVVCDSAANPRGTTR